MAHTKEPWEGENPDWQSIVLVKNNRDYISACVKACGVLNPKSIPGLVEALEGVIKWRAVPEVVESIAQAALKEAGIK